MKIFIFSSLEVSHYLLKSNLCAILAYYITSSITDGY
jgi:hypothetical protein